MPWRVLPPSPLRGPGRRRRGRIHLRHPARRRWYQSSPATGMKSFLAMRMISASEKASSRPVTPLFQVQPSGWPSISQSRIGLPSAAALARASQRPVIQGICAHFSLPALSLMRSCRGRNWSAGIGSRETPARPGRARQRRRRGEFCRGSVSWNVSFSGGASGAGVPGRIRLSYPGATPRQRRKAICR